MKSVAEQLRACIHCGLCLDACPTYRLLGDEAESPRGRLQLMQYLLERPPDQPLDFGALDRCLGCRHCEAVCPSGVPYGELLEQSRERLGEPEGQARWLRWFVRQLLIHPKRFALISKLAYALRPFSRALPEMLREAIPERAPAWPRRDSRPRDADEPSVYLFPGCAQQVLQPEVIGALETLVEACGHSPRVLTDAGCCGALEAHLGDHRAGEAKAAALTARSAGAQALLVPAAGCSAHLQGAEGVADAVVWLHARRERLRFRPDPRRVLYHPPCHHSHAQGIRDEAFELLAMVPELTVLQAEEPERCCGSAGSYQLLQPDLAKQIRAEKLVRIRAEQPDLLLSANPGCELFLEKGLQTGHSGRMRAIPTQNLLLFLARNLGGLEVDPG